MIMSLDESVNEDASTSSDESEENMIISKRFK